MSTHEITNDPIHGIITLHPLLIKIIDTPQFQRLRNIKQLGGCYFVYPGASHNRFEHSIGVCHLAGKLARHLQQRIVDDIDNLKEKEDTDFIKKLEDFEMTNKDVLCIEIAGLCHDIGHGPYSHLFDMLFKEAMERKNQTTVTWKHEDVSQKMFMHMIEKNAELKAAFKEKFSDEGELEKKINFILALIDGKIPENEAIERHFMYEIVANSQNGIDVDKMDYFARDCHGLGMKSNFDHDRYISQCRVMFDEKGKGTIAVRDKEIYNLYELFHTRIGLYRRAYYHKVTKAVEIMLTEALVAANDVYPISIQDKTIKLSDAWEDMDAYEQLTDRVFENILYLPNKDSSTIFAKKIIRRIYSRQLYKMVHETKPAKDLRYSAEELTQKIKTLSQDNLTCLTDEDFVVEKFKFNYGKKENNPIEHVYFYEKGNSKCFQHKNPEEVSLLLPREVFQEQIIRVYAKREIPTLKGLIKKAEEELIAGQ